MGIRRPRTAKQVAQLRRAQAISARKRRGSGRAKKVAIAGGVASVAAAGIYVGVQRSPKRSGKATNIGGATRSIGTGHAPKKALRSGLGVNEQRLPNTIKRNSKKYPKPGLKRTVKKAARKNKQKLSTVAALPIGSTARGQQKRGAKRKAARSARTQRGSGGLFIGKSNARSTYQPNSRASQRSNTNLKYGSRNPNRRKKK